MRSIKWIVGIDEAGRGALAGPVAVGAAAVPADFDMRRFEGVRDSKKLSPVQRDKWRARLRAAPEARFAVSLVSASLIDARGISWAVRTALARSLVKLRIDPRECLVLLDGGLTAPAEYARQETIIGGDDIEPIISLASIAAKTHRDRHMIRLCRKYPEYGFSIHKGYGTLLHRKNVQISGLSVVHRTTYCTRLTARKVKIK